jgi:hypothetical protein
MQFQHTEKRLQLSVTNVMFCLCELSQYFYPAKDQPGTRVFPLIWHFPHSKSEAKLRPAPIE